MMQTHEEHEKVLEELIELSHGLGRPERKFTIIGEGNTSASLGDGTFFLKASGTELATIDRSGFVLLYEAKILELLPKGNVSEEELKRFFEDAKVDRSQTRRPSVEALMHAICLSYDGVKFVGHTHPTEINKLTCSTSYPENLKGRMYPDEIVVLGIDSVFVPYTDPGIPMALKIKEEIDRFIKKYDAIPKSIYIQNHGFVALGGSAVEVENITLTASKAAEVRLGALLAGGINILPEETVRHIKNRPDEKYRQALFEGKR
jgi:rhamnose utilization protein RhaD (predicted bifunctional aldolase and dehydrogenase)